MYGEVVFPQLTPQTSGAEPRTRSLTRRSTHGTAQDYGAMKLPASGALARNVTVAGQSIKMIQHFMDTPVAQPRRKGGPKADLTGLKVWPVSLRLVEYMHAELLSGVQQRAGDRPLRVLELGAGCGSLGIGLAALGLQVVLTDPGVAVNYSEAEEGNTLGWLRANVDANRELLGDRASVAQLLWGDAAHMEAVQAQAVEPFDLVVGSDVLYDPDQYPALLRTLAAFTTEETDVVLGFTRRHPGEARFLKSARLAFRDVATRDMAAVEADSDGVGAMSRWSVTVMRGALEE